MRTPMKHLILSLGLCVALVSGAAAQAVTPKGAKSDEVMVKVRQIDILNQLLPLALRKSQYNGILTALEKARQKEKQIRTLEDGDLEKIYKDVDDAVTNAIDKGTYPPNAMQGNVDKLLTAMGIRRQVAIGEMVEEFYDATSKIFDAGQKKVMANSLDAAKLDPSVKKDQMTEEQKIKFFIRKVFLDQITYDLLVKMEKTAS